MRSRIYGKKRNIDIRNEGGGVKGRLDFIRKFILYGRVSRPLSLACESDESKKSSETKLGSLLGLGLAHGKIKR